MRREVQKDDERLLRTQWMARALRYARPIGRWQGTPDAAERDTAIPRYPIQRSGYGWRERHYSQPAKKLNRFDSPRTATPRRTLRVTDSTTRA